jgi:hypothetical protein
MSGAGVVEGGYQQGGDPTGMHQCSDLNFLSNRHRPVTESVPATESAPTAGTNERSSQTFDQCKRSGPTDQLPAEGGDETQTTQGRQYKGKEKTVGRPTLTSGAMHEPIADSLQVSGSTEADIQEESGFMGASRYSKFFALH